MVTLPYRALIVCPDADEADVLFQFLDEQGVYWDSRGFPLMEHLGLSKIRYADEANKVLTYNLDRECLGFCYESWYRDHPEYENKSDPRFNYCSVQDFMKLCCDYSSFELHIDTLL